MFFDGAQRSGEDLRFALPVLTQTLSPPAWFCIRSPQREPYALPQRHDSQQEIRGSVVEGPAVSPLPTHNSHLSHLSPLVIPTGAKRKKNLIWTSLIFSRPFGTCAEFFRSLLKPSRTLAGAGTAEAVRFQGPRSHASSDARLFWFGSCVTERRRWLHRQTKKGAQIMPQTSCQIRAPGRSFSK
jgi:hypothetical protein